jgi:hypothetical protein
MVIITAQRACAGTDQRELCAALEAKESRLPPVRRISYVARSRFVVSTVELAALRSALGREPYCGWAADDVSQETERR